MVTICKPSYIWVQLVTIECVLDICTNNYNVNARTILDSEFNREVGVKWLHSWKLVWVRVLPWTEKHQDWSLLSCALPETHPMFPVNVFMCDRRFYLFSIFMYFGHWWVLWIDIQFLVAEWQKSCLLLLLLRLSLYKYVCANGSYLCVK